MATTTRAMPALMIASTHGGVRPWCAHGSSVTTIVAPRGSRIAQRLDLRVRFAGASMPSLGDDLAVADDDAADHRVWADGVASALGESQGAAHEVFHGGDCRGNKKAGDCSPAFGMSVRDW